MIIVDDKHGLSFLTSSTPVGHAPREKYTSRTRCSGSFRRLALAQATSATIRTPGRVSRKVDEAGVCFPQELVLDALQDPLA